MSDPLEVGVCQIPGNSDIAGVGVRASVYAQACLAGFNLLYMLHAVTYSKHSPKSTTAPSETVQAASTATERIGDPESLAIHSARSPSPTPTSSSTNTIRAFLIENADYISMTKALERSLFMIGFAVILSAILEARSDAGLNAYHALIVLNISQINNWAGFLLLLLRGGFRTEGTGWIKRIFVTRKSLTTSLLCIAHSSMMSGLGLYFWANPIHFLEHTVESEGSPCRPEVYFWVFGAVNITSSALRRFSLAFYTISIVPIFGLYFLSLIPGFALVGFFLAVIVLVILAAVLAVVLVGFCMVVYLVFAPVLQYIFEPLYFLVIKPSAKFIFGRLLRNPLIQDLVLAAGDVFSLIGDHLMTHFHRLRSGTHGFLNGPFYAPFVTFPSAIFFSAPLLYSIVSTELIIRINAVNVEPEAESTWTYGQTLALFSALVAISLYLNELINIVRRRRRRRRSLAVESSKRPKYMSRNAQTERHVD